MEPATYIRNGTTIHLDSITFFRGTAVKPQAVYKCSIYIYAHMYTNSPTTVSVRYIISCRGMYVRNTLEIPFRVRAHNKWAQCQPLDKCTEVPLEEGEKFGQSKDNTVVPCTPCPVSPAWENTHSILCRFTFARGTGWASCRKLAGTIPSRPSSRRALYQFGSWTS